jgi:rSAM/selenodomain-associated transferase 2
MISVVIPTLNEASRLTPLLAALASEPTPHEVIVADGGSADSTRAVAAAFGAAVVVTPPGRGRQIRAGAVRAQGDVLLFLHADSRFPAGGLAAVVRVLAERSHCPGGNFRLVFDGADPFSRWLDGFYAFIRARGFYYGDSALFVRRCVYDSLGGMRPLALMEDYDFVRRLERVGQTCSIAEPPLVTSSRRFRGRHPAAIVFGWLGIHALYYLGVDSDVLARLYDSPRRRQRPHDDAPLSPQSYS